MCVPKSTTKSRVLSKKNDTLEILDDVLGIYRTGVRYLVAPFSVTVIILLQL